MIKMDARPAGNSHFAPAVDPPARDQRSANSRSAPCETKNTYHCMGMPRNVAWPAGRCRG